MGQRAARAIGQHKGGFAKGHGDIAALRLGVFAPESAAFQTVKLSECCHRPAFFFCSRPEARYNDFASLRSANFWILPVDVLGSS